MITEKAFAKITEKAFAKINLALDVLFKRMDGYHEVDMIMQTVSLCDVMFFQRRNNGIMLIVDGAPELACGEDNLIIKAARVFQNETGVYDGAEIVLRKKIPMEAGLAGGSADAAAALRGLNRLWKAGIPDCRLREMAAKIGSDVAFCVAGGTARATGRGEIITALPAMPRCAVLIFKPDFGISTAWAYGQYATHAKSIVRPDVSAMIYELAKQSLSGVCHRMGNVLESVSLDAYPEIGKIKAAMIENGALNAMMSGSGTAVFGIFDATDDLVTAGNALTDRFSGQVFACCTEKSIGEEQDETGRY